MKIARIESWREDVPLTRPYSIAFQSTEAVTILALSITADDGTVGLGAATPEPLITGETVEACARALAPSELAWLVGRDLRTLPRLLREMAAATPGARAAVDMALHDLLAKRLGLPLADLLGRAHDSLPTSITIGIKPADETLTEAQEYLERGFRILKVKIGAGLELDLERLVKLRERFGTDFGLRADANQGYDARTLREFLRRTRHLAIELVEQPLKPSADEELGALPEEDRARIAADESLHGDRDALRLSGPPRPFGIWNIKLMKSGGIAGGLRIAAIAETAGVHLMWGCMDESVVGISAALHAAFASPATRYLDLDGSLDLSRDFARGGFVLEHGLMRTNGLPGLGVER
ncbi:MAG: mandelate racemase/muconate lactonizing enzyme family protein [Planctomycetota bacterium]